LVNPKLFGTSGVRGVVNVDLTPTLALNVGLALATYINSGKVAIGHDTRVSSPMLEHSLISGLLAGGSTVIRLGLTPTPLLAFLTREIRADAGVMITASHNPPEYNGIKLFNKDGMAYDEKQQNQIEEIVESGRFKRSSWQKIRTTTTVDESRRYLEAIQKTVKLEKEWRVLLDPGCGATCQVAPVLFRMLGCKVTAINSQPDGFFPGRSPEPDAESLQSLSEMITRLRADLGIAYDGDGDRMVAIDENGVFAPLDQVLAAYASHVVKAHEGGVVVTNVEASMCVEKMVNPNGGKVVRTKVGDAYIASAVKQHKAVFGGEPCGAWIHPQYHYCPDGILSSVLLLKTLEEENKTLSSFVSEAPQYPIFRENLACPNEAKSKIMEKMEKVLPSLFAETEEKSAIDGVRLTFKNGWVLIRPSGTEPIIRVTAEAESEKEAKEITDKSVRLVKKMIKETV